MVLGRKRGKEMGYLGNKLQGKYHKDTFQTAVNMAWPAIVESFFIAFAGLVDSLMVSSLGSYAVAAVGLTTQPKLLGLAFFFALNVSISALVARRRGEQRQGAANETLVTALVFIILAAAAFSVGFVAFASPIIHLCGSTAETHNGAVTYFRIIMGGMIFNCIQMGINSAQRGAGNTKITMRTNVTSNTINIILNYLLINGHFGFPALGIQGAALATVTGTVVGCVMSILSITKQDGFLNLGYILKNKIKPTLAAFISLVRVGYSVFFEQVFMRIGFMMTAIMAAKQGTDAMAAHQVGTPGRHEYYVAFVCVRRWPPVRSGCTDRPEPWRKKARSGEGVRQNVPSDRRGHRSMPRCHLSFRRKMAVQPVFRRTAYH